MAKDKSVRNDGSYIFADFSKGLYLLETPRFITEQLASLALVDGRNVWAEKGALVPQYGYEERAVLPPSYVGLDGTLPARPIAVSKGDSANDDFMILANEFQDIFNRNGFTLVGSPDITDDGIMTETAVNNGVRIPIFDTTQAWEFGIEFTTGATIGGYQRIASHYSPSSGNWTSQIILINDDTIAINLSDGTREGSILFEFLRGNRLITRDTKYKIVISFNGSDTYMLKVYKSGELAITREVTSSNICNPSVPLFNIYSSNELFLGTIDLKYVYVVVDGTEVFSGTIPAEMGAVYLYSASQGLKKFKTSIAYSWEAPILARRGKDLCIYDNGEFRLFGGSYTDETEEQVSLGTYILNSFTTYSEFSCSSDEAIYFWNGKEILVDDAEYIVSACFRGRNDVNYTVRVYPSDGGVSTTGSCELFECTTWTPTLVYEPDNIGVDPPRPDVTLVPKAMGVAQNRLFIEHTDGTIYYSAVGIVNNFNQEDGSGFFSGFYNDTSKLLSIEDFLSGAIITKENGMYYLTLGGSDGVKVEKISQVGQQFASDHVIVGEKIYAYDRNIGGLVNAISVSAFGALVAGKPLVTSEYLNGQNFELNNTNRALVYNAETQVLILYYGENLNNGIVYLMTEQRLYPRQLDKDIMGFIGFNQGVMAIGTRGEIMQDFKKGTIIPSLSCVAVFEPIGVRDNRLITSTILEVTELNGVNYTLTTVNAGDSYQKITPSFYVSNQGQALMPFLYSDDLYKANSYELTSRWAEQSSHMTRIYAPMSGRNGISITLEFEPDKSFILSTLRLPDFSQGN